MKFITQPGQMIDKETIAKYPGAFMIGVYEDGGKQIYQSLGRIIINGTTVLLKTSDAEMDVQHPMIPTRADFRYAIDKE